MNNHFKTTGIVLNRSPFKEADLRVTLITRDQGKITALAKNARRWTNRLCGKFEPFYEVALEGVFGQSFSYIKEAEMLRDCPIATMDLAAQNALHFLAELTHRLTVEEQETQGVFELWQILIENWSAHEQKADVLLHAGSIKLLTELGFMASWQHCVHSNEKLDLKRSVYLNAEEVSLSHQYDQSHSVLSPTLVKWVNFMQKYPLSQVIQVKPSSSEKKQVWNLLQRLIYPLLNKPLKSERFLVGIS